MNKRTAIILAGVGIAGYFLYRNSKKSNSVADTSSFDYTGGGSASITPQNPASLSPTTQIPTTQTQTPLSVTVEAPQFETATSTATAGSSKKTTSTGGSSGTPQLTEVQKILATDPSYKLFDSQKDLVSWYNQVDRQGNYINRSGYSKKTTTTPVTNNNLNWAQQTAGQAYTGWSRLTNTIKGWFS